MSYDGLNRLKTTQATSLWGSASYGYDALDNLTSSSVGSRSYTHTIDASNHLTALSGSSSISYGYDTQGNVSTRGTQSYVFDQANRLSSSSTGASYIYDGLGRRAKISKAGTAKVQVYTKAGQLVYETSQGTNTRYIYLDRHLITKVAGGAASYIHTDGLGSPVATTDSSGTITSRSNYEPFGQPFNQPVQDGPGYTGHVMDADTGLSYMQQRYYDPIAGRFLSDDPVATDSKGAGNFNRYAYAANNPAKYIDADGRNNELGLLVTYDEDFSRRDNPNARDIQVLGTAQRAVDLTVKAVMRGGSESRKADLKLWKVAADPAHEKAVGGGTANTIPYPARDGDPKEINTVISAGVLKTADTSLMIKSSEGITARGGDPALTVMGIHELAHGSDQNMKFPPGKESESDVGKQVREVIKALPDIQKDIH